MTRAFCEQSSHTRYRENEKLWGPEAHNTPVVWTELQTSGQGAASVILGVLERGHSSEKHVPYFWLRLEFF